VHRGAPTPFIARFHPSLALALMISLALRVGLHSLPGVTRLVTWNTPAVINWSF
jgi:hypothetical protein